MCSTRNFGRQSGGTTLAGKGLISALLLMREANLYTHGNKGGCGDVFANSAEPSKYLGQLLSKHIISNILKLVSKIFPEGA